MEMYINASLLVALLAASAFTAAAEVSFLSISRVRLHSLLEKKTKGAESIARLRQKRRKVVIALLIGNNLVNIAASAIATSVAIGIWGEDGLGIAVGVMAFLILTFGDIAPKSFATANGERFMLLFSPLVEAFYWACYPLVLFFDFINRLIPGVYSRPTGVEQFTEDEVRSAIRLGAAHKGITEKERELLENVLAFNDRTVGGAMTPKSRVATLDAKLTVWQAHLKVDESNYSRFPVMANGKVIGTVSVKAISKALDNHPDWQLKKIAWRPVTLRADEKASEAFGKLQKLGRNIAVVANENGEFAGVVTLEDLLEELVGEIK